MLCLLIHVVGVKFGVWIQRNIAYAESREARLLRGRKQESRVRVFYYRICRLAYFKGLLCKFRRKVKLWFCVDIYNRCCDEEVLY